MMKLAFCLFNYFPFGGLQRDFLRIARESMARGHEVHVYTMEWEGEEEPGLVLHLITPRGWQNHTRVRHFAQDALKDIKANHFDLVVGFNKMPGLDIYYAADVCYQARVHEQRGWFYRLSPRYRQHVAYEKAVFAQGLSTQILLISSLQQPEFIRCYGTEVERFHLLPPGIAKDRLAPPGAAEIRKALRDDYHLTEKDLLIVMVGSGFKTKGLDRSIRALAALSPDVRLHTYLFVIGQDDPAPFLKLAQELGVADCIQFLGGRSDVPHFLLAADLLLHPSYHENTGTAILEAMASGLPVLTLDCCGYAPYVTKAQAGLVLPGRPFDQETFNQALHDMLLSPQRKEWGKRGLEFARRYDIYSLPEKAVDVIEKQGQTKALLPHFEEMMALKGQVFRNQKGRLTQRVTVNGQSYFIKQHTGIGWKEVIKNVLQLRWPVLGAKQEWLAIKKLQSLGIGVPEAIAFESRGKNPASQQSYILMQDLSPSLSLEDISKDWKTSPPVFIFKKKLIEDVASIAKIMHENGINHRDFYICHFLLDAHTFNLSLIDLHRAQIRRLTPERWIIKDLAGLYFSSKDIGLTQRDLYRFMKRYSKKSLREILNRENVFWQKVKSRGEQLYRDHTK